MDFVILANLPMPPSVNAAYINRRAGCRGPGRIKSKAYRDFERAAEFWRDINQPSIKAVVEFIKRAATESPWIELEVYFCFPREALLTNAGNPKRRDVDNRLKIFNDALAKILDFDDCIVAKQRIEKIGVPGAAHPWVSVAIRRHPELMTSCPLVVATKQRAK